MRKTFIIIISCILFAQIGSAQSTVLSKKKMYADFDEMIKIMEDCNAQLPVRKAVTGIDHLAMAKSLRANIDTITRNQSFNNLLQKALQCMFDIHAKKATGFSLRYDNLTNIDTTVFKKEPPPTPRPPLTYRDIHDVFPGNPFRIGNDYFLPYSYSLVNEIDTISLYYSKIIAYNNIPYSQYVRDNLLDYPTPGIRWDYKQNLYYSSFPVIPYSGTLTVDDRGKIKILDLDKSYGITIGGDTIQKQDLERPPKKSERKKALYFKKDSILYIYLDNMMESGNIIPQIKEIGSTNSIAKVIIDVRGNTGGGDEVWHAILKAIVADTIPYNPIMAFKNTKRLKKIYDYPRAFSDIKKLKVERFQWLPDEEFLVTNFESDYFYPDSNSIKYKGKIYILQDEDVYSSGHSFTTYASHIEQLVSVGEPTGLLAGFGLLPMLFQLKHSKFTFRMETAIDVTNVTKPVDVYQDFPEIIIPIPAENKMERQKDHGRYDQHTEIYLYTYDYLFKKVLELP